jgi:thiamine biosynthesis lipoprotein
VAIEKPLPEQRSIDKIITLGKEATPLAVMTSGTYRHFYDDKGTRYSHILDARTGYPVTHRTVSVTVLYSDATLADAWSTALLCLGKEAGLKVADHQNIPALFIEQSTEGFVETSSAALQSLSNIQIE